MDRVKADPLKNKGSAFFMYTASSGCFLLQFMEGKWNPLLRQDPRFPVMAGKENDLARFLPR